MDLKFSFPLIFWLILRMIQEKHWEYNAMATESRESTACEDEKGVWRCQGSIEKGGVNGSVCTVCVCVLTCSIVSGEQISSPRRIMERWVRTSDSWKASKPSSSLAFVTTERWTKMLLHLCDTAGRVVFIPTQVNSPCLVVIWAPPAVMNSMFPSCKTPDSSLNMSLISSSVNWSTFRASYAETRAEQGIRCCMGEVQPVVEM